MLSNAGIAPDQYGLDVAADGANKSVMMPLVRNYVIEKGHALYIPVVGTRTVTARARSTETSGAGTGDEGTAITFNALDDTKLTMTKRFVYDAFYLPWEAANDFPQAHRAAWFNAEVSQIGAALGNDVDGRLLALYSSASDSVGGSGDDTTLALLNSAIKKLRIANAPEPYSIVLPETQWDKLAGIRELTHFDVRGEGDTLTNRQMFRLHGVNIFTTGNVPTASSTAHGLAFSGEGIRLAVRDMATVEEWRDGDTFTDKVAVFSDFAYVNTFSDWIVDFQTTDA